MNATAKKFILIAVFTSIFIAIIWYVFKRYKDKRNENLNLNISTLKGGKNNPGHLRYVKHIPWKGKIYPPEGKTFAFESFDTLEHGIRAWLINARTHIRNGKNTIDKLIDTLTPASENPESARKAMKNDIRKILGKENIEVSDLWKIAHIVFKYEGNPDYLANGQNIQIYPIAKKYNIV